MLGRTETRTRDRIYCQTMRTVRDISRDDRARIATCSLRTLTDDGLKANYSIDYHYFISYNNANKNTPSCGRCSKLQLNGMNCVALLLFQYHFISTFTKSHVANKGMVLGNEYLSFQTCRVWNFFRGIQRVKKLDRPAKSGPLSGLADVPTLRFL